MSNSNLPKHRFLNDEEQKNFILKYREIEAKYPLFNLVRKSRFHMWLWFLYIVLFLIYSIVQNINNNIGVNIIVFVFGIIGLQIVFVASHIKAHAFFLEYENHIPSSTSIIKSTKDRIPDNVVYYYAFYHHHHTKSNNWAPLLSYYNYDGANNVAVAHWISYTMLGSARIILVIGLSFISPLTLLYYSGYEIAVIMLPFAHRWQHIDKSEQNMGIKLFFTILEFCGIVANRGDHKRHHIHNGPTVYQDFSSSGIYAKYVDNLINKFWDYNYYKAVKNGRYVSDYIAPCSWFCVRFILIIIPFLFIFL